MNDDGRRRMNLVEQRARICATGLGVALAILLIGGCADDSSGVPVEGRVTYRGEPIPRGALTFFPATGRPRTTPVSPQGYYDTVLPVGEYRVVVNIGADLPEGWKEGDPVPRPELVLPAEYTTRARSVLSATVTEGQSEPIDFALE